MGRIAQVLRSTRTSDDTGHGLDVVADPGGSANATAPHYSSPGVDSAPLPGDYAALEDSTGVGEEFCAGYADTANAGLAAPGEVRLYSRASTGAVQGDVWIKGDGTIVATNAGGSLTLSPGGVLMVGGSSDAAALASVVDAILSAIAACVPAPAVPAVPDTGEPGLASIKLALVSVLTSASTRLKVSG